MSEKDVIEVFYNTFKSQKKDLAIWRSTFKATAQYCDPMK